MPTLEGKVALVTGFTIIALGYFVHPFDRVVASMHDFAAEIGQAGIVLAVQRAAQFVVKKMLQAEDPVPGDASEPRIETTEAPQVVGFERCRPPP